MNSETVSRRMVFRLLVVETFGEYSRLWKPFQVLERAYLNRIKWFEVTVLTEDFFSSSASLSICKLGSMFRRWVKPSISFRSKDHFSLEETRHRSNFRSTRFDETFPSSLSSEHWKEGLGSWCVQYRWISSSGIRQIIRRIFKEEEEECKCEWEPWRRGNQPSRRLLANFFYFN